MKNHPIYDDFRVGDKVRFKRGEEFAEGTATVKEVDYRNGTMEFSDMPEGIEEGDEMVWISRDTGEIDTRKMERY